jgi:uncharacterized RDD family membrane protein YckC
MKCPKCQYIGFDDGSRCRNCGYDFSLLQQPDAPMDLPMRADEPVGPMVDLGLHAAARRRGASATATPPAVDQTAARRAFTPQGLDLPLFEDGDDRPLVNVPAVPRQPLAVRRAAPVTPRARVDEPVADEPELAFPEAVAARDEDGPASEGAGTSVSIVAAATDAASAGRRLTGALIDAAIIGAIDAAVIYLTLKVAGVAPSEVRLIPPVPMLAFLLMLNGGYLTIFTAAGGQTIGKMIAGTRVTPAASDGRIERVPFGTAVVRAAACFVSVALAGAGFLMALFRTDGRALHDTVADTRVIRA